MNVRLHTIPVGGTEPIHATSRRCWCHPLLGEDGITVHNAKDVRERYERQGITNPKHHWCLVGEEVSQGVPQ